MNWKNKYDLPTPKELINKIVTPKKYEELIYNWARTLHRSKYGIHFRVVFLNDKHFKLQRIYGNIVSEPLWHCTYNFIINDFNIIGDYNDE